MAPGVGKSNIKQQTTKTLNNNFFCPVTIISQVGVIFLGSQSLPLSMAAADAPMDPEELGPPCPRSKEELTPLMQRRGQKNTYSDPFGLNQKQDEASSAPPMDVDEDNTAAAAAAAAAQAAAAAAEAADKSKK